MEPTTMIVLLVPIMALIIFWHCSRIKKGRECLKRYLDQQGLEYQDIAYKFFPPLRTTFFRSDLHLFFVVTMRDNSQRIFRVGGWFSGLMSDKIVEV